MGEIWIQDPLLSMFKTKPGKYDLSFLGRQMFLHCQMLHLRNCTDKNQCHWPLSSIVMHFVVVTKQITSPFFLTIFTEWLILTHCIAPEQMQQYLCARLCYYSESISGGVFSAAPPRLILHAWVCIKHPESINVMTWSCPCCPTFPALVMPNFWSQDSCGQECNAELVREGGGAGI